MSIITSQQLSNLYSIYKTTDVTFTKEVIFAISLVPNQVFLRCLGNQWPCVIYSTSLSGAKVIVNIKSNIYKIIREANNTASLRFCFQKADKEDPIAFFVTAKVAGFTPYNDQQPDLNFLTLNFTQRPPDDLIEVLGLLLDANANAKQRKEERIIITPETSRKIGLKKKEAVVFIDKVPRKCIIRDLSFSGAKVLLMGIGKFLVQKKATIRIEMEDPDEIVTIAGEVLRFEEVEGRKDMGTFAIKFIEESVSMKYKIRINDYLKHIKSKSTE
jgi:hypothetical protein